MHAVLPLVSFHTVSFHVCDSEYAHLHTLQCLRVNALDFLHPPTPLENLFIQLLILIILGPSISRELLSVRPTLLGCRGSIC